MVETSCPECDAPIKLGARVQMGQLVKCSECEVTLEVIDTNPPELDVALIGNIKFRHRDEY
ncbi:MAG: lysine biosynthesis protein LysW [Anaerolineae bacterium]|nr:lysine biosynthesis protein LysW [Anaerolineae bacterium]